MTNKKHNTNSFHAANILLLPITTKTGHRFGQQQSPFAAKPKLHAAVKTSVVLCRPNPDPGFCAATEKNAAEPRLAFVKSVL
jgi:hypothetical protein